MIAIVAGIALAALIIPVLVGVPGLILTSFVLVVISMAPLPGRAYIGLATIALFFITCVGVVTYAILLVAGASDTATLLMTGTVY